MRHYGMSKKGVEREDMSVAMKVKYIWTGVFLLEFKGHAVVPRHGWHTRHTHRVQFCRDHATDAFSRSIPANQCRARLCDALTKNKCLITCLFAALFRPILCLAA